MPTFYWQGLNLEGKKVRGKRQVQTIQELLSNLQEKQIALLSYRQSSTKRSLNFSWSQKIKPYHQEQFFELLSILLDSGIELSPALEIIYKQTTGKLQSKITQLAQVFNKCGSFSKALYDFPKLIPVSLIPLISMGEQSANLSLVCNNIAQHFHTQSALKKQIKQASLMPLITLGFAMIIVIGIFLFVIPQFDVLFATLDKPLPTSTKRLLAFSNFLHTPKSLFFWAGFPLSLALYKQLRKLPTINQLREKLVLSCAWLRTYVITPDLIKFLSTLKLNLEIGVPTHKALQNAHEVVANKTLKKDLMAMIENIEHGRTLSYSLNHLPRPYFPQIIVAMIDVGEKTENLPHMINKATTQLQQQLNKQLKTLTTLIQPFLLIFVGIVITSLLVAVYLPIFTMASGIN